MRALYETIFDAEADSGELFIDTIVPTDKEQFRAYVRRIQPLFRKFGWKQVARPDLTEPFIFIYVMTLSTDIELIAPADRCLYKISQDRDGGDRRFVIRHVNDNYIKSCYRIIAMEDLPAFVPAGRDDSLFQDIAKYVQKNA